VKRTPLVFVAVICAAALLSACGNDGQADAATVNATAINRNDFQDELQTLADNKGFVDALGKAQTPIKVNTGNGGISTQLSSRWLNSRINQTVVDQAFERRHLKVTPENRSAAKEATEATFVSAKVYNKFPRSFRDEMIERAARLEALKESLPQPEDATDAVLQELLTPYKAQYCPSGKLVAHILVKTKAEADAIEAELAQGADFATLATEQSTDTGSAPVGGLVACTDTQAYEQLVAEFRAAVDATPIGSVSPPVQSEFGYHIIKVSPWDLANARPVLEQIFAQQQQNPVSAFVNRQLLKAKIWVDPRYGTVERANGTVTIAAPKSPNPQSKPRSSTTTTSIPTGAPAP
jgi:hypothetical protein